MKKTLLSLCVGALFVPASPAFADTLVYDGDSSMLQDTPAWEGAMPDSLFPGTTASPVGSDNSVTVNSGDVGGDVYGGLSETDDASNNTVILNGGTVSGEITGGQSVQKNALNNTVIINGGTADDHVYGGYSDDGNADGNRITINSGTVNGDFIGGQSDVGTASGNTVTVNSGTVSGNVVGGESYYSDSINNTITIGSDAIIEQGVWGGYSDMGGNAFTGNSLNISGRHTLGGIYNFESLRFTLPNDIMSGGPMITSTGDVDFGGEATIQAIDVANGDAGPQAGDTVTIIQSANGISGTVANDTATGMKGMSTRYEWENIGINGDVLTATLKSATLNPQTHALLQGRSAQTGMLIHASDLVANAGLASMQASAVSGNRGFFAMDGGSNRYGTGSHISLDSFSAMAGAAWGSRPDPDTAISAGLFLEAGTGSYNSSNSFTGMNSVRGSGNTDYAGAGVLGSAQMASGFHADAAIRAGRVKTDLKTNFYNGADRARYDNASSLYLGGHVNAGYQWNLAKTDTLDTYLRYIVTWMDSDSVTVLGERYHFDSSASQRVRGGVRYNRVDGPLMPFAGVAYEYEFDGKSGGRVNGSSLKETDMGGGTVIGEIGLVWAPQENVRLDVSLEGFAGQRDGIMGNLRFNYRF